MAYAVVEVENISSWTWFLQYLIVDIGICNDPSWTIISDKQKGLEKTISDLLPAIKHRHCVRHLHNNCKNAGFGGQSLKDRFWNLARASYMGRFNAEMQELKIENKWAYEWLVENDPVYWTRSHFSDNTKCDIY